jgi:hypothetical protein
MPFWDTLDEVLRAYKFINGFGLAFGLLAAVFAFVGAFSAVGSYYYGNRKDELQAISSKADLDRVRNTIHTFSAHLYVEYSWPTPNNPLLEEDQGGGIGEEDHLQLVRQNFSTHSPEAIYLKRINLYQITKISDTRASFDVDLIPRNQDYPIGSQISELDQIKNIMLFIPVKNYWMNGRDTYQLRIEKVRVDLFLNGAKKTFLFDEPETLSPVRAQSTVLWGYLTPSRKFVFANGI